MSETSGSIYTWIGQPGTNSDNPQNADSWRLFSGPGEAAGRPDNPGDGGIIPASASLLALSGAQLLDNSLDIQGGSVAFTNTSLLGPVTVLQIDPNPALGELISFTITTPSNPGTPYTVNYTVTAADLQGDALANIAANLASLLKGSTPTAALSVYAFAGATTDGSLAIGSFAGVAPTITAPSNLTVSSYGAATLTDSGGTSATFDAIGQVYNGGVITADVPGGAFTIAISSQPGSAGNAGDLINLNQILVTSGDNLTISAGSGTAGSGTVFDNLGTIDVSNGTFTLDVPSANDTGIIAIGASGRAVLESAIDGRQRVVFDTSATGGILQIDAGALDGTNFDPKIVGFQSGDEIYLPGITYNSAADAVSYAGGNLIVTSSGTTLVTLSLQTGIYQSGSITLAADGAGGLDILTTAGATRWLGGTSTAWNTASNWSGNAVPSTSGAAVVIDSGAQTTSLTTGAIAFNIGALTLADPTGFTLDVAADLTIKRSLINLADSVNLTAGTLSATTYQQIGAAASLIISGGTLNLSGSTANGSAGISALVLTGNTLITGGSVTAAGYAAIGIGASTGNVEVQNATVSVTYTVLGSSQVGGGTLTLSGAQTLWTDTAADPSVSYLYGTTLPGIEIGTGNNATAGANAAAAFLLVTSGAALVDNGAGVIGVNLGSSFGGEGEATITNSGSWQINSGADLAIGANGATGELNVSSGGTVALAGGSILAGVNSGSGTVNIGAGGTISTTGALQLGNGGSGYVNVSAGGQLDVTAVQLGGAAQITLTNGTVLVGSGTAASGSFTVANGGTVIGAGSIDAPLIVDNGAISASLSGETLALDGAVVGSGTLTIATGATLALASGDGSDPQTNAAAIDFAGSNSVLALASPASTYGAITGFGGTNLIDLQHIAPSGLTFQYTAENGTLDIFEGTQHPIEVAALVIGSGYGADQFTAVSDHNTGSYIEANVPCYCRGTRILTDRGELPVEDLVIGDQLVTAAGGSRPLIWIGKRAYHGRFIAGDRNLLPILFKAGSLAGQIPRRDLYVSPLHAFYLDEILVPAWLLTNGHSIVQLSVVDTVEYFHLELATHDIILAEGAPAESFIDEGGRAIFQNAAEYAALYPEAQPKPPLYCAPRLEQGAAVEAIRARLSARVTARPTPSPSPKIISLLIPPGRRKLHLHQATGGAPVTGIVLDGTRLEGEFGKILTLTTHHAPRWCHLELGRKGGKR